MIRGHTESSVKFVGIIGSEMKYANGRWEITDSFTNEILAYMNGTSQIPLGKNQWHFPQSKCSDEGKDYRTLIFHKYVKQPGHYCCNDGTCITSEYVCDGAQHCAEGEEEQNCKLIEKHRSYDIMIPPSNVTVDFNIDKILGINDHDDTFDVYFSVKITWFDNDLKYNNLNLRNNDNVNIVPKDERNYIWVPNIEFAYIRELFSEKAEKLFVEMKGHPSMSEDLGSLNVSEMYDGNNNPLIRLSEHNIRFFCEFMGVANFPFGLETCSFDFYFEGRANKMTEIISNLDPPTQNLIDQYEIMDWNIKPKQTKSKKNVIRITVTMGKKPISIIMMTYIPVLLMNIINQATNYITGDSKYDLIITVNITSMVVLATIYMSVSISLPSTANIKPIEVWLLFNLAYPILVILANIVMKVSQTNT